MGHSSPLGPPTRPNPEAREGKAANACPEEPVVFDVYPTYQQTVSTVGLFFSDFFKELPRIDLPGKEARQVQGILAVPSILFSRKVLTTPLGNFSAPGFLSSFRMRANVTAIVMTNDRRTDIPRGSAWVRRRELPRTPDVPSALSILT
jgi:hypothetical protein